MSLFLSEGFKWGLGPWGVGSANLGRPVMRSICKKTLVLKGFGENWGFLRGAPNLQIKPSYLKFGNGPNTVSESTVSNPELSEFFWPHRVLGRELSEFLSAYCLRAKANSPSSSQNSPSFAVKLSEAQ